MVNKMNSKVITIQNFHATKLNNDREIYIYLPPSYETNVSKRYPVLYMHDGQNIFYQNKSSTGLTWNMKNIADTLIAKGNIEEIIIVGIEFKDRGREFFHGVCKDKEVKFENIFKFTFSIEGKGELYEDFLINDLKSYIDQTFRTKKDRENTALMGSSMGGFVTFNIGLRCPHIFSKLGMVSPAFFYKNQKLTKPAQKLPLKMWFDIGEKEGTLLLDTRNMVQSLLDKKYEEYKELVYYEVPNGFHSEIDWGERVKSPLIYFFGDIGNPIKIKLYGRNKIGLEDQSVMVNAIVEYDSGFTMSDLNGNYVIEDPEILDIKPDGKIIPKKAGSTKVTYILENFEVSKEYEIIKDLSKFVIVDFKVEVPESTPNINEIFIDTYNPINFKLKKISENLYGGTYSIPRGLNLNFKTKIITDEYGMMIEKDKNSNDIDYRELKATDSMKLYYSVQGWGKSGLF